MNKQYCHTFPEQEHRCFIELGSHILSNFPKTLDMQRKFALITDETVYALYGKILFESLLQSGHHGILELVPPGETSKTRAMKERIEDHLISDGFGRDTVVIALGGGVITDLAGYLASTYCRGVDLILIPTTLMAMVDASIGGKNGINLPLGKNMIGTIYHPQRIIIDPELLTTLPDHEISCGIAEIVKHAILEGPPALESLEQRLPKLLAKDQKALEEVIFQSCRFKAQVVTRDAYDLGPRQQLNFGHTIGHAIEQCTGYHLPHGEAVAMGMLVECQILHQLGMLSSSMVIHIERVLRASGLRMQLPRPLPYQEVYEAMIHDKKSFLCQPRFVLISDTGAQTSRDDLYCTKVTKDVLQTAIAWMNKSFAQGPNEDRSLPIQESDFDPRKGSGNSTNKKAPISHYGPICNRSNPGAFSQSETRFLNRERCICAIISGPTYEKAYHQLQRAHCWANSAELRIDLFDEDRLDMSRRLILDSSIPIIATVRTQGHGGNYFGTLTAYRQLLYKIGELRPAYIDIESHISQSFFEEYVRAFPQSKIIVSHHDGDHTPQDLEGLYQSMIQKPGTFYKLIPTARTCEDALRLLVWAQRHAGRLIAHAMGLPGQLTRILAPVVGSPIVYAPIEGQIIPGQIGIDEMMRRYRVHNISSSTKIYALLGSPINTSISHVTHNALCDWLGYDAVYVKMKVDQNDLPSCMSLLKELPVFGLSITMPLKEAILPLLDRIDPVARAIGAVNTVAFEEKMLMGYNTDGCGALAVLEQYECMAGKRIIVLGCGGAARAIAYEAIQRGSLVTLVGKTPDRLLKAASDLGCDYRALNQMSNVVDKGYEVIVNATSAPMPIPEDMLIPGALAMDLRTVPMETPFLTAAQRQSCRLIYGYQMFAAQAAFQWEKWLGGRWSAQECKRFLDKKSLTCASQFQSESVDTSFFGAKI